MIDGQDTYTGPCIILVEMSDWAKGDFGFIGPFLTADGARDYAKMEQPKDEHWVLFGLESVESLAALRGLKTR